MDCDASWGSAFEALYTQIKDGYVYRHLYSRDCIIQDLAIFRLMHSRLASRKSHPFRISAILRCAVARWTSFPRKSTPTAEENKGTTEKKATEEAGEAPAVVPDQFPSLYKDITLTVTFYNYLL